MRILLVEDTADVADAIARSLDRHGHAVDLAASRQAAEDALAVGSYDVIVLDWNLPDGSGVDVLSALRASGSKTPVLILTARLAIDDRVSALDLGADDYLTKPFDLRELEARVRALMRRTGEDRGGIVRYGALALDPAARVVTVEETPLELTRREFSLLEALLANRERVIEKQRLFDRLFGFEAEDVSVNALELYVARLRRKLAGSGVAIKTLRGLGYQLLLDDGQA